MGLTIIFFLARILEEIITFFNYIFKFPFRLICRKKGHKCYYISNGFLGNTKYIVYCKRCGERSTGGADDLTKKHFDYTRNGEKVTWYLDL